MEEPNESTQDLIELIYWLSSIVFEYDELRMGAIALPPEECKKMLMMEFPVVQGFAIRSILKNFGSKPKSDIRLKRAIEYIRLREAHNSTDIQQG